MPRGKAAGPSRGRKLVLSVGLVNVPVRIAPLTESTSVKGSRLCPEHVCPINQGTPTCSERGHDVDEPVTGFEHEGRYVTGIDRNDHKGSRDGQLKLVSLVDLGKFDPLYYDQAYLLWPDVGGESGHDLLAEVLRKSKKALIGETVMTTSNKALAIRWSADAGALIASTIQFDDAIRWNDVELVKQANQDRPAVDDVQVKLAEQLLSSMPSVYELEDMHDEYANSLTAAIAAKAAGQPVILPEPVEQAEPTQDLMAALQASLAGATPPATAKAKRNGDTKRAPAKRANAKRSPAGKK